MGCSGASSQITDERAVKIVVHGDIFTSDTRSALTVLEIGQLNYSHVTYANKNTIENALGGSDDQFSVGKMSEHAPVIEEPNAKRLGPGHRIIQHCALKDCRNKPRFDDNGKLIK